MTATPGSSQRISLFSQQHFWPQRSLIHRLLYADAMFFKVFGTEMPWDNGQPGILSKILGQHLLPAMDSTPDAPCGSLWTLRCWKPWYNAGGVLARQLKPSTKGCDRAAFGVMKLESKCFQCLLENKGFWASKVKHLRSGGLVTWHCCIRQMIEGKRSMG